jgi:ABC-2 type transport system ATP-binding protein
VPRPVIETHDLTRDFATVRAVDSLTLDVPSGVVFGFLGPNGSGKTTTIRLLMGLLEPTSGGARVLGHDVASASDAIRASSGALMEHSGLYERLTAQENLEFFARANRVEPAVREARVRELLGDLGLWERRSELVGGWSRGMKQKLAVARTLLHRPRLVFLDEPTAGLDPIAAAALRDDLAALVEEEGVTVFLTTHNLAEAERLCGLVGVIREGRLIAVGSPDELRSEATSRVEISGSGFADTLERVRELPEVAAAMLENGHLLVALEGGASTHPVVSLLVEGGARIEEVRHGSASLEDAFMALMDVSAPAPASVQGVSPDAP